MPTITVKAKSSGTITLTLDGTSLPLDNKGEASRDAASGEHRLSWRVRGKGSSYEVHVTRPASVKRDRSVEATTKEIVVGGFSPFTM